MDALTDLMNNVAPIGREKDETKKAEMKKKIEGETLPSWMKMMEGLLTKQGGNYFAGSQLTWADIAVYSSIDMMKVRRFFSINSFYYIVITCRDTLES